MCGVECVSLCVRVFMDVCMCMSVIVIVPITICISVPIHVGEGGSDLSLVLIVVFALYKALCASQSYKKYHIPVNKVRFDFI